MSRPRLIAWLLALITLVVYLPASTFSFINYDDDDYVTNNAVVKHGMSSGGIIWAFTKFHAGNWHPLTWISHMADCELFGLNAGAHHFVNVLIHTANVVLLFVFLFRLTQKIWASALVAALFAWHPLHVESVAWIAERKDVLSTFFALLALLAYARFVELGKAQSPKAKIFFALSLLAFLLGLLAKPMLVTLPFVLLLLDFWPWQRLQVSSFKLQVLQPLVMEKIPFFLLTIILCAVTFFAQRSGEAVVSLAHVSLRYRCENAIVAVADYLRNFFWPEGLCVIYPMPDKISPVKLIWSGAVMLWISLAAWNWRKSKPYFITGWLWFLGTLVPVIGLVQVGGQAMADRYTYIPSIGFFIALVFLARDFALKIQMPKAVVAGGMLIVASACILVTERQLQFWQSSETLFRHAVAVTDNNDIALVNLGAALEGQGKFADALEVYRQAEKIDGSRYQLYNNLGNVLGILGRHEESLAAYRTAMTRRPGTAFPHNGAGLELVALGQFTAALSEFAEAARLNPGLASPHLETAKILFKFGREAEGAAELRVAAKLDPDNFQTLATAAHYFAAADNVQVRDGRSAVLLALQANELSGHQQPMVYDILGMAFAAAGDFTNAATCAQNALTLARAAQLKNTEPIRQRLELYQKNSPWVETFRETNSAVRAALKN